MAGVAYGTVNPWNTQVAPAVKPKPGSRDVDAEAGCRRRAGRSRVVMRPPIRTMARLSVPAGGVAAARVGAAVDLADDLDALRTARATDTP